MSQPNPQAPQSGPSRMAWAWFAVASLIAVSLVGILVVLLLKDATPSTTAQMSKQSAAEPAQAPQELNRSTADENSVSSSGGSDPGIRLEAVAEPETNAGSQDAVATIETSSASEKEKDGTSADTSLSAADIVSTSTSGVVLISTLGSDDQKVGVGSGFLIDQSGLVATNFHILRGSARADVEFRNGESIPVRGIRAYDESADLAILEIDRTPEEAMVLKLADHADRPNASAVISVGHPEQFKFTPRQEFSARFIARRNSHTS